MCSSSCWQLCYIDDSDTPNPGERAGAKFRTRPKRVSDHSDTRILGFPGQKLCDIGNQKPANNKQQHHQKT